MPFHLCPSGCVRSLSTDDGHDRCLQCLGFQHAEDAFVDDSCACCGRMSMTSLRSRLSFLKGLAPSAATRARFSGSSREPPAGALGDLRVTVRASPPGTPLRTSYSSRSERPVWFPGDFAGPSHGAPSILFGIMFTVCVCVFTAVCVCVCTLDGLNAEHKLRVCHVTFTFSCTIHSKKLNKKTSQFYSL